jgi:hypothetical protein
MNDEKYKSTILIITILTILSGILFNRVFAMEVHFALVAVLPILNFGTRFRMDKLGQ